MTISRAAAMTALVKSLATALAQLDDVRASLNTLLTLIDAGGLARADLTNVSPRSRLAGLTKRQHDLLVLVSYGWTNADIGRHTGLAEPTIKNGLSSVYRKLEVPGRVQAALLAHNLGIVPEMAPAELPPLPPVLRYERGRNPTTDAKLTYLTPKSLRLGANSRLRPNPNQPRTIRQRQRDANG